LAGINAFPEHNPGEFTIKQLAEKILELVGGPSKLIFKDLPKDDPKQRRPDIDLAKEALGWEPTIHLDDGLQQTIADLEARIAELERDPHTAE